MTAGRHMGVKVFVTETGHYRDPSQPAPAIPYEFQDATWPRALESLRRLADLAERHDVRVLLEPFYRGFLATAKRTRVLLEELGSPRVRVLSHPANLIELNDLEEMFQQLGPWTDCIHAKDRKLHMDRGLPAGQGDVDYSRVALLAARHLPHAPGILEYSGQTPIDRAAPDHVRAALRAAGLSGSS